MKHVTPGLSVLSAILDILSTLVSDTHLRYLHCQLSASGAMHCTQLINRAMFTIPSHLCHRQYLSPLPQILSWDKLE